MPAIINELRTEEISDEADALFLRVKEFLIVHQRPGARMPFLLVAIVAIAGIFVFGIRGQLGLEHTPWRLVISALVLVGSLIPALKVDNYLSLETRLNSPSFWSKHKDAFATHIVTSAISAIVGVIVGYLLGRFLR